MLKTTSFLSRFYKILASAQPITTQAHSLCTQSSGATAQIWNTKICKFAEVRLNVSRRNLQLCAILQKYNKRSASADNDSDDENDSIEFKDERDSKVVKTRVNSLRVDLLLKAGLGLARNKVETIFYDSKIRVNGKKLAKKSVQLNVGDEIDVIRNFSQTNPSHLVIARVVILDAEARDEGISVHLRRYKSMLVENYTGLDAYKSSDASSLA